MKPILKIEYKDSGCSFDYFCYVNLKNFPTFSKITLTLKHFLKSVFNVSFSSIYMLIWGKKLVADGEIIHKCSTMITNSISVFNYN